MLYPSSDVYFSFLHNWSITKTIANFLTELKILPHRQPISMERKSNCFFFPTPVLNFCGGEKVERLNLWPVKKMSACRWHRIKTFLFSCKLCLSFGMKERPPNFIHFANFMFAHRKNLPANNLPFRTVYRCVIHFFKRLSSSSSRAPGELDGHQGDPPGGHGVPAQIPGGHHGGAAQRRGAVGGRRQENSGHGKEGTARLSYPEIFPASSHTVFRFFSCDPSGVKSERLAAHFVPGEVGSGAQAWAEIQRMQLVWMLLQSLLLGRLCRRRRVLILLGLAVRWMMKLVAAGRCDTKEAAEAVIRPNLIRECCPPCLHEKDASGPLTGLFHTCPPAPGVVILGFCLLH